MAAIIFGLLPLLHRFGELVAPLTLLATADLFMIVVGWKVGTHTGIAFFFCRNEFGNSYRRSNTHTELSPRLAT